MSLVLTLALYAAPRRHVEYLGLPNPRGWQLHDADWKLPADSKQIVLDGMKDRLERYRSFRLFMDICVRCGACADYVPTWREITITAGVWALGALMVTGFFKITAEVRAGAR